MKRSPLAPVRRVVRRRPPRTPGDRPPASSDVCQVAVSAGDELDTSAMNQQMDTESQLVQTENEQSVHLESRQSAKLDFAANKFPSADERFMSTAYSQSSITAPQLSLRSSLPGDDLSLWLREKFPQMPIDDLLFASYSCALVKAILLQGRLYVTSSALIFYAKIFGKVTKEFWHFKNIAAVRKRRSGFVANSIKIVFTDSDTPSVVFASLNKRERACALIKARLQAVRPAGAQVLEEDPAENSPDEDASIWRSSSLHVNSDHCPTSPHPELRSKSVPTLMTSSSSNKTTPEVSESGTSSDGLDHRALSHQNAMSASHRDRVRFCPTPSDSNHPDITPAKNSASRPTCQAPNSHMPQLSHSASVAGSRNSALLWKSENDVVDRVAGCEYARRVEQARTVLNAPIRIVFDALFAGDWLLLCHASNGNTNLSQDTWARDADGFMTRTLNFNRALGYRLGPKTTRVVETQKYSFTSAGGAVVELSGHNLDVPFGDNFRVESYIELFPVEAGSRKSPSTIITASVAVHFAKNTVLRSKIESGALAETKSTFNKMLQLAAQRVEEAKKTAKDDEADKGREFETSPNTTSSRVQAPVTDSDSSPPRRKLHPAFNPNDSVSAHSSSTCSESCERVEMSSRGHHDARHGRSAQNFDAGQDVTKHRERPRHDSFCDADTFRRIVIFAGAFIAVLILLCISLLIRLRADVRRLEQFAAFKNTIEPCVTEAGRLACNLVPER